MTNAPRFWLLSERSIGFQRTLNRAVKLARRAVRLGRYESIDVYEQATSTAILVHRQTIKRENVQSKD